MAAWLNEGRCPGGRPSVSTKHITIEADVFCIEMATVHVIWKHRIKLAVFQSAFWVILQSSTTNQQQSNKKGYNPKIANINTHSVWNLAR